MLNMLLNILSIFPFRIWYANLISNHHFFVFFFSFNFLLIFMLLFFFFLIFMCMCFLCNMKNCKCFTFNYINKWLRNAILILLVFSFYYKKIVCFFRCSLTCFCSGSSILYKRVVSCNCWVLIAAKMSCASM